MIEQVFRILAVQSWGEFWWVMIGLGGQLLFTARFLVQWIASERAGRSVIPLVFWYFSIGGGLVLFAYAVYRQDPVFILGQSMGVFIYGRNLWLIHAERRRNAAG
ncbi:lipid-A-disaccharide synthase N-terminal domain-containing protein [Tropicimonas sp. TH_r6]|uniref:lipid-A-disaccharide synthase N-terminal domain-containing protein n=1 Tax=Tropicimonas sp. TH_r6 TaxID=3082085 RepID=UPI0029557205|nr:lipid-A-disaccharide synthase N-terminal domain-containing protein [Tropicimonas sp. TH_r6]MDV7141377.1 lipid-A-disaccharide synthase N-terminal domain-containing protein [Tropicimonas sp. TH_r6]